MALGKQKETQDINVNTYSVVRGYNSESNIDKTTFNITFWNKMLVLTINPLVDDGKGGFTVDIKNSGKIFIHHLKALILYKEIEKYLEDPTSYKNVGIASGSGIIFISNGIEFSGKNNLVLGIRDLDENGNILSEYLYEFNTSNYAIRNFIADTKEYDTIPYKDIEIIILMNTLKSYYMSINGAIAHSVREYSKFDNNRIRNDIDSIMDKLGISRDKNYSKSSGNNSFFSKNKNETTSATTKGISKDIEDIEDEFDID